LFRELNAQIARLDPDFVVVGGDIAYTRGSRKGVLQGVEWEAKRWQLFFEEWQSAMVGADGRLIPLVAVLGNHDICSARGTKRRASYMFYDVFAFPQPLAAYRVLDVGEELSLILLDTGHMTPIAGEQAAWLEGVLAEREEVPYKMAVYHVGAYPAVYKYGGRTATRVRESWCPLFDRYHVRLAFEHHSHAYKRTHPIQSGKVDPEGVVYLGDGCWGVSPRTTVSLKEAWYLARAASKNHFFLVSVNQNACCVQAFGSEGQLLDAVEVAPYRPLSGDEAFEEAGGACCEGR
jgi:3',5'-cyclic AMP phosphodiesterase CpdA